MKVIDYVSNDVIRIGCSCPGKLVFFPFNEDYSESEFRAFLDDFLVTQKTYKMVFSDFYVSKP